MGVKGGLFSPFFQGGVYDWWMSSGSSIPDADTFDRSAFGSYSIPVSVALRDTFDGTAATSITSHSPETGGAWSLHPSYAGGTAVLSGSSSVYGTGGATDAWFLSATSSLSESYEVSYKLKIFTNIFASATYCGVVLDANAAAATGYQCQFFPTGASAGNWLVQKVVTGSATTLTAISGTVAQTTYSAGTELDVRWQIDRRYVGNSGVNNAVVYIRLWVNGVKIAEWKDNSSILSSTKRTCVRFVRTSTTSTGHHINGLSIHDISYPELVPSEAKIAPSTAGTVVTLRGFGTAWDALQPAFVVSGATKTAQSVVDYSTATITLTTGSSAGLITITDPSTGVTTRISIAGSVGSLAGWTNRKQIKITGSTEGIGVQNEYEVPLTLHTGTGTDTATDVYLGNNVRSDWGDIRITDRSGTTMIPFKFDRKESTYAEITIWCPILNYSEHSFFLYWGKSQSAGSVYKIASITDQHYDTGTTTDNRDQTLNFIDNFVAEMSNYLPDLAVSNGDKTGASNTTEATQLSWYQSVLDRFALLNTGAVKRDGVAPGNHDFEYMSFSNVLAKHSGETWMESGAMYGSWESTDYKFISLDSNYDSGGSNTHLSLSHVGYGFINTNQTTWLQSQLSSATKPVVVFCHHPLCELDTEQFTLDKEIYHVRNREQIRKILEDSGKVIAVIHGHVHYERIDVINNIPYIVMGNLTNTGAFGELPSTNTGNFSTFELDKEARTIKTQRKARVSGSWVTVYEQTVPFGFIPSLSSDVADHPDFVLSNGNKAVFEKSNVFRSPSQSYVTDDTYLYKFPANRSVPDPYLSDKTIKITGRTNNPNFGRDYWHITQQRGKSQVEFSIRIPTLFPIFFKFGGDAPTTTPGPYLVFNGSGEIRALNAGVSTLLQAYSINTWYKIKLIFDVSTDTYSVYVDDVLRANGFSFNNVLTFIRQCELVTETGAAFIDNLRVRKYVSPEPTLAVVA